ncbi:abortive infection system antitoxin AbiGi family protein [Paracidovorax citrulli]|uniref:abortive infection system antitoxin AbiGi family protein n=1 Tax=Paracidovorax citrulli TaxID=80869 RepID=UPI0009D79A53|nr:hypothetical protein CQB05_06935 [Paracidovorax citrulli]UMT82227.1 hypothetical protein FRC75_01730 [Paracidovorax citrulli]
MVVSGSPVEKDFYQESEWRYVPKNDKIKPYIYPDNFKDEEFLAKSNNLTFENCLLKFEPIDIKYIFVEKDSDIPSIVDFINTSLDRYANSLKILISRIVSLESIKKDL